MKIPVYQTGRVGGGTTLPGVSRTARKNPNAMAQAELNKAAPLLTAMQAATSFMVQRQKMATNILYNETLLSGEAQLRELAFQLEKDPDVTNVMDRDSKWVRESEDIRLTLFDKLSGNQAAQAKFNAGFKNSELQLRFQLRNAVDENLVKREQASLKSKFENKVAILSDPKKSSSEYEKHLIEVTNDLNQGVDDGRFNLEAVDVQLAEFKKNIADGAVKNWVQDNISSIQALEELYLAETDGDRNAIVDRLQDDLEGGEYAFFVLEQVSQAEAETIIFNAKKQAIDRTKKLKELDAKDDGKKGNKLEQAQNKLFNIEDDFDDNGNVLPVPRFTKTEVEKFVELTDEQELLFLNEENAITSQQYKELIYDFLNRNNYLDRITGPLAREEVNENSRPFASQSDGQTYAEAQAAVLDGYYTMDDLIRVKKKLSRTDYSTLLTLMEAQSDEGYVAALKLSKSQFSYEANLAKMSEDDAGLARASIAAHQRVANGLAQFQADRIVKNKALTDRGQPSLGPLNANEYANEYFRLYEENKAVYLANLKIEYEEQLELALFRINGMGFTTPLRIPLNANPLLLIDDWKDANSNNPNTATEASTLKILILSYKEYYETLE